MEHKIKQNKGELMEKCREAFHNPALSAVAQRFAIGEIINGNPNDHTGVEAVISHLRGEAEVAQLLDRAA